MCLTCVENPQIIPSERAAIPPYSNKNQMKYISKSDTRERARDRRSASMKRFGADLYWLRAEDESFERIFIINAGFCR